MARNGRPPIPPRDSSHPQTLRELAGILHISYDRARRLRQDGLSLRSDGRYDLHEALALNEARRARTPGLETDVARSWNDRLKKARALQAEHDLAVSLQLVMDVDEVRTQWRRRLTQIHRHLSGLGSELAPRLAHRGPQEILAIMDQHVLQILRELADPGRQPTHEQ
jgi:hypothetical protein